MDAVLRKNALTETYLDVEKLINNIVWKFWKKYGGERSDWKAQANLQYIKAYDTYKTEWGKFSTWLYMYIWRRLQDYHKKLGRENHVEVFDKEGSAIPFFAIERKSSFHNIVNIIDEVKEDGRTLISLILDPPENLNMDSTISVSKNKNQNKNYAIHARSSIRQYLLKAGWTGRRIKESFEEIGAAINA